MGLEIRVTFAALDHAQEAAEAGHQQLQDGLTAVRARADHVQEVNLGRSWDAFGASFDRWHGGHVERLAELRRLADAAGTAAHNARRAESVNAEMWSRD